MTDVLLAELSRALDANSLRLREALRREMDRLGVLEPDQRVQLEIDPNFYRVSFVATEEDILPDDWLAEALAEDWFERAGEAFGSWDSVVEEPLAAWIADCWRDLDGKARFSPAFVFFHGYHHRQYDLERREWLTGEAFEARWG